MDFLVKNPSESKEHYNQKEINLVQYNIKINKWIGDGKA